MWHDLLPGDSGEHHDGASQPGLGARIRSEGPLLSGRPQGSHRNCSAWTRGRSRREAWAKTFSVARHGDKGSWVLRQKYLEQ